MSLQPVRIIKQGDLVKTREQYLWEILEHGIYEVKVIEPFSPSFIRIQRPENQRNHEKFIQGLKEFYKDNENELRVNFNDDNAELSGLPVVFKVYGENYVRGYIILINTGINNIVLTYDPSSHKNNIFYINNKILMRKKNIVIIALTDIKPKRNNAWDRVSIQKFRAFIRDRKFLFYKTQIQGDRHLGWGKLSNTWSLDDWLIEESIAKLSPDDDKMYLNYDEVIEDLDEVINDSDDENYDNVVREYLRVLEDRDIFPPRPQGA